MICIYNLVVSRAIFCFLNERKKKKKKKKEKKKEKKKR